MKTAAQVAAATLNLEKARAAKRGRGYSVRNVGRKGVPRVDLPHVQRAGKAALGGKHSYAHASTNVFSTVPGIRIREIRYRPAVSRTPSGAFVSGTGVFVNTGKGLQGHGLRGYGGLIGVKGRAHLGIRRGSNT